MSRLSCGPWAGRNAGDGAYLALSAVLLAGPWGAAREPAPSALPKVRATAGWVTFGQALPRGAYAKGKALRLGEFPTQTDVKTTWPDGSVRFAVVTALVKKDGQYQVAVADPPGEAFAPGAPDVSVKLTIGGEAWVARLPDKPTSDLWLSGPSVVEWRSVVAPRDGRGRPHGFLRVVFDTRVYRDGQARADVTVENALDLAGATRVTYDVAVLHGAKALFEHKGLSHGYLTRWRKVFPLGLQEAEVIPDFEPCHQAAALPRYLPSVAAKVARAAGPRFEPLQIGDLNPDMRSHGGRPELAPYPDWAARYLVHKSADQRRYVLAHGDLAGSWPVHLREPDGGRHKGLGPGRLVSIDERPNFWLDYNGRGDAGSTPAGDMRGQPAFIPDNAHVPSLAYVPYLITGDRYYAEEMAFWANNALLRTFQDGFYNARGGSQGLLAPNETRGIAWALRNLADAAAYLPDTEPLRPYFAEKVKNNLRWADGYAEKHVTPLGTVFETKNRARRPGRTGIAAWENNYVAWAVDHANRQRFEGGRKLRDRIARFQLSLFNSAGFPKEFAAVAVFEVGEFRGEGKEQTVAFFRTAKELFEKNFPDPNAKPTPFAGYYGVDQRLMLLVGLEAGWEGASEAYDYLHPQIKEDLAARAGWAIAPVRP